MLAPNASPRKVKLDALLQNCIIARLLVGRSSGSFVLTMTWGGKMLDVETIEPGLRDLARNERKAITEASAILRALTKEHNVDAILFVGTRFYVI